MKPNTPKKPNRTPIAASISLLLVACMAGLPARAQTDLVERVVAVIDNEIILHSDIEGQYQYYLSQGQTDDGTLRCTIFENLLMENLLLAKARLDSLEVSDDRVDQELNRRLERIITQMGSQQQVEAVYKQSIYALKADLRETILKQLLAEEQRKAIYSGISVTPREVKEFFNNIPKDSLPLLPAEVEINHIVIKPTANEASKAAARAKLEEIRQQILRGEERFEALASYYGQDGTAKRGGSLGEFGRGVMDPDFEGVVFNLQDNELSEVFETQFGYHLVRLDKRLGERVQARHILIIPEITKEDQEVAKRRLSEIRTLILSDSLTFEEAAVKYSEDEGTKSGGGALIDRSGEPRIPLDQLDAETYLLIDPMKVGDISEPTEVLPQGGGATQPFYRIVWLKNRVAPHRASLQQDYPKFQQAAIKAKEATALDEWFEKAKRQVYIEVKAHDCTQALSNWQ